VFGLRGTRPGPSTSGRDWPVILPRRGPFSLDPLDDAIGREIDSGLDAPGGPADFQAVDARGRTQPEVDAQVVVGDLVAAAVEGTHERARPDPGHQPRSDGIEVGTTSPELGDQPIPAAGRFVPEDDAVRVVMDDDRVQVAIAVEVAAGEAAPDMERPEV